MSEKKKDQNAQTAVSEQLMLLMERAEQGDENVIPEIHKFLDAHPEVWQHVGNMGLQAERVWIALIAGSDLIAQESIKRHLAAMRKELAGSSPSALEKMLVDRIVLTWLQNNYGDAVYGQQQLSIPQRNYLQRRQDKLLGRHLAAIKALATVRKLLPRVPEPLKKKEPARSEPCTCTEHRASKFDLSERMRGLVDSTN